MTRTTNARIAGFTFLFYIAAGIASLVLFDGTDHTLAPDSAAAHALGAFFLRGNVALTAIFFAVGSTLFSYLLLRGRMIPIPLAWLGVVASVLLVMGLPLQPSQDSSAVRSPRSCGYQCSHSIALWLLIKGVAVVHPLAT